MTDSLPGSAPAGTGAAAGAAVLSDSDAAALSAVLWREREVLETLLLRLVEQQHLLAAGAIRWLPRLDAEVAEAARALQDHEVVRATEVEFIAQHLGLGGEVALTTLARAAGEPWSDLLLEHLAELRSLMGEIQVSSAENQRLLRAGEQATRDALERSLGGSPSREGGDYAAGLGARGSAARAHLLDRHA
jgi:FlgN protein